MSHEFMLNYRAGDRHKQDTRLIVFKSIYLSELYLVYLFVFLCLLIYFCFLFLISITSISLIG